MKLMVGLIIAAALAALIVGLTYATVGRRSPASETRETTIVPTGIARDTHGPNFFKPGTKANWMGTPLPHPKEWCQGPFDKWVMAQVPGTSGSVPACVMKNGTWFLGVWRIVGCNVNYLGEDQGWPEPTDQGVVLDLNGLPRYDYVTICPKKVLGR